MGKMPDQVRHDNLGCFDEDDPLFTSDKTLYSGSCRARLLRI